MLKEDKAEIITELKDAQASRHKDILALITNLTQRIANLEDTIAHSTTIHARLNNS